MQLQRFDPLTEPDLARACHEMYLAGRSMDDPDAPPESLRSFSVGLALGWWEDPREVWLARDEAGQPCGWCAFTLPQRENRHLAHVQLLVSPPARRHGAGTALVRHAARQASGHGRTLLASEARCGGPAGGFAQAAGARPGLSEVRRVLAVDAIPAGHLARLRADAGAAAAGYTTGVWHEPVPAGEAEALRRLYEEANDAPRDEGQDGQRWDDGRLRKYQYRVSLQGARYYTLAARSAHTGELAALTQLEVDPQLPGWGMQELTVVARAHRGHRLGLLVKVAMLELLACEEPQLTRIITGNAGPNKHMIAINDQLGFRELDRWRSWELSVDRALALPA